MPSSSPSRGRPAARRRSLVLLAAVLALVALLGTGCVRVRAGLAVSPKDTVSGTIDVGTPDGAPGGNGPPLQVPSDLSSDVTVTRYEQDGYVGSHLAFEDLSFDDVSRLLPQISPTTSSAIRLQLRRAGDRVILSGQVDLTRVSPESADVQLKMAFPGPIRQTDGTVSQGVVAWTFTPGEVGEVNAVAEYPDPNAPVVGELGGAAGRRRARGRRRGLRPRRGHPPPDRPPGAALTLLTGRARGWLSPTRAGRRRRGAGPRP